MFPKSFPLFRRQVLAFLSENTNNSVNFSGRNAAAVDFRLVFPTNNWMGYRTTPGCVLLRPCHCRYFSSVPSSSPTPTEQVEGIEMEEEGHDQDQESGSGSGRLSNAQIVEWNRKHNIEVMSRILDIDPQEIRRVSSSYKIKEDRAKRTVERLQQFGFSKGSPLIYPELLFMNPGAVENYIRIMRESQFSIIREEFITKFRSVIRRPLLTLRIDVGMPSLIKVIESFCDELEVDDVFFKRFVNNLPKNTERVTLFELRRQIIASYLSRLSLGDADTVYDRFFTKYPRLNFRSLNWIKRNYRLFKDEVGLSNDMLQKHCYLLQSDPDNVSRLLQLPSLAGMNPKSLLQRRPRLAICSVDGMLSIERSFLSHDISLSSVQKQLELYTLSPQTIRKRLEQLENTPELRLLKVHPRIGRLLYYHNKAMERLEEFKTMDVIIPSIHLLSQDKGRYKKSIAGGEVRTKGVDIIVVLSKLLKVTRGEVRQSLTRHQHWVHVPTLSVKETLSYLQNLYEFSKEDLVNAIPLMLYPQEKVQQEVENVLKSGEAKLEDPYFLNMVMYFIERHNHFTGDGIWPDKMVAHDDDPDPEEDNMQDDHDDDHDHEDDVEERELNEKSA